MVNIDIATEPLILYRRQYALNSSAPNATKKKQ